MPKIHTTPSHALGAFRGCARVFARMGLVLDQVLQQVPRDLLQVHEVAEGTAGTVRLVELAAAAGVTAGTRAHHSTSGRHTANAQNAMTMYTRERREVHKQTAHHKSKLTTMHAVSHTRA